MPIQVVDPVDRLTGVRVDHAPRATTWPVGWVPEEEQGPRPEEVGRVVLPATREAVTAAEHVHRRRSASISGVRRGVSCSQHDE